MERALAPVTAVADLAGRRCLVLGLARSGTAAARMLSDAGAAVTVYDRRPADELSEAVASLGDRHVAVALGVGHHDARRLLSEAELVVTSPSISPRFSTTEAWLREALQTAEAAGTEIVSEVGLFLRLTRARIVGVTGTKGKTTTTALIGEVLRAAGVPSVVGGNIGTPLIERVGTLTEHDWVVLELSELQLPTVDRGADVAVYTNITADHLDRHGSVDAYRAVKARLGELTVARGGKAVLNADDPGCRDLGARLSGAVYRYGFGDGPLDATVVDDRIVLRGDAVLPVADVPLPGRHMLANVLAAALAASLAGASRDGIATGIRAFRGVPHRLETVAVRDGIRFVNDSQATIPLAAIAALEAYTGSGLVLIAGGRGKGLEYGEFADAAARHATHAILLGEAAEEIEQLLGGRLPVTRAASMDEAVSAAAALAQPGNVVLLSPAAASFDMFADYAARGDAFRSAVAALPPAEPGA
jgi:UDP-N-acetylmuramoylalanine--D-glutamate ligase